MIMAMPFRFLARRPSAEMSMPRWRAIALLTGLLSTSPTSSAEWLSVLWILSAVNANYTSVCAQVCIPEFT